VKKKKKKNPLELFFFFYKSQSTQRPLSKTLTRHCICGPVVFVDRPVLPLLLCFFFSLSFLLIHGRVRSFPSSWALWIVSQSGITRWKLANCRCVWAYPRYFKPAVFQLVTLDELLRYSAKNHHPFVLCCCCGVFLFSVSDYYEW
jgi:hypothetical protein